VQLIIYWVLLRVLEELSQRDGQVAQTTTRAGSTP
jgi:hypothetical protein